MLLDVVTVCTHDEGWYAALHASCQRHGLQLTVLGWGERWRGFNWKFHLMREYLAKVPADRLVAFVDAYDVIVLCDAREIVRRFRKLTSGGPEQDIVLGVENPLGDRLVGFVKGIPFRPCGDFIINSGVYMGTAGRLRRMLALLPDGEDKDDQKLLNNACRGWAHSFFQDHAVLDASACLIFNANCTHLSGYVGSIRCRSVGLDPENLVNPRTGKVPCFLHMPGGLDMDPCCRALGLPLGKPRPRVRWRVSNVYPERYGGLCAPWAQRPPGTMPCAAVVLLIVVLLTALMRTLHT